MKSKAWRVASYCLASKDTRVEAVAVAILLKREYLKRKKEEQHQKAICRACVLQPCVKRSKQKAFGNNQHIKKNKNKFFA